MSRFSTACVVLGLIAGLSFSEEGLAQMQLDRAALSNAGGVSEGGGYTLVSSLGQGAPGGDASGGGFLLRGGYVPGRGRVQRLLVHTPPGSLPQGQDAVLVLQLSQRAGLSNPTLYYRRGGEEGDPFGAVPMVETQDGFAGTIPAEALTSRGLLYYMTVEEVRGYQLRAPAEQYYTLRVAVPGVTSGRPVRRGTTEAAYQLVSVPIDLARKDPAQVFADDLGPYDDTAWRLFELLPGQTDTGQEYAEYPNTSDMVPGKAFWLITTEEHDLDTGPGTSTSLQQPYGIGLHPRWNLIGNPFHFPIPVENLQTKSGQAVTLRAFEGGWNDPEEQVTELLPFAGYAVFNNSDAADTLFVDPAPGASSVPLAGRAASRMNLAEQPEWAIHIAAQAGSARDADNRAGILPGTASGPDGRDLPDPPVIGDYVAVYFPHPEWGTTAQRFCTDLRPQLSGGEVWAFEVETRSDGAVSLAFEGVTGVPEAYEVWIYDEAVAATQDLRTRERYRFISAAGRPRRLKLLVGDRSFLEQQLGAAAAIPQVHELAEVFPNPFASRAVVRYGLPVPERVVLKVYTMLGSEVATLVEDAARPAGYHVVEWDGSSTVGTPLANGVYLMVLRAGDFSAARKVILVR